MLSNPAIRFQLVYRFSNLGYSSCGSRPSSIFLSASSHKNITQMFISLLERRSKRVHVSTFQKMGQVDTVIEPLKLKPHTNQNWFTVEGNENRYCMFFSLSKEQFSSPFWFWKNGDTACFIGCCSIMEMGQSTVFQQKCWDFFWGGGLWGRSHLILFFGIFLGNFERVSTGSEFLTSKMP